MNFFIPPNVIRKFSYGFFFRNYSTEWHKCSKTPKYEPPWRILFFGTDVFSLESLKALCAKLRTGTLIESLGVVSKEGSIVEKFGNEENLPYYKWPLKIDYINKKYDIGMVVSFGNLIGDEIIQSLPLGCINVHASILPRWRGAAPIVHAIMNGDIETGITVMRIQPHRFDVGEIVRQYRIPIHTHENATELEEKLAKCGSHLLMDCLRDLPRCVEMAVPQPDTGITYAPKIRPEMSRIIWEEMTAKKVFNLHRALSHIYPLSTKWHGSNIKLIEIQLDEDLIRIQNTKLKDNDDLKKSALTFLNSSADLNGNVILDNSTLSYQTQFMPGTVQYVKKTKELKVKCKDGNNIIVNRLRFRGKLLSALDFYNGYLIKYRNDEWRFGR